MATTAFQGNTKSGLDLVSTWEKKNKKKNAQIEKYVRVRVLVRIKIISVGGTEENIRLLAHFYFEKKKKKADNCCNHYVDLK